MTSEERRITFLHGILTRCLDGLNHALTLTWDPECFRLVSRAYDAVEKAKAYNERAVDVATDFEKEEEK